MTHTNVDNVSTLSRLLQILRGMEDSSPSLFLDLEGVNLSRHGTISILQLYIQPEDRVYLIDVHKLGAAAFDTPNAQGTTLRNVLESRTISKVIFDVRNDSNALHGLSNIVLAGVVDLQLMELATRPFNKKYVAGLKKRIERDAPMATAEKQEWLKTKDAGSQLFDPQNGGNYAVFNKRPLSETMLEYCIQDVFYLPNLWRFYSAKLTPMKRSKVYDATHARIEESQNSDYNAKGPHKLLSPWPGWPTSPNPSPT